MNKIFYCKKQILKFKANSELITDEDINNLFSGLVGLIKKNTEIKMEEKYGRIINRLKGEINDLKLKTRKLV